MLAVDYPILNLFWTIMIVFLWVAWIILVIRVISDIFRNHDMKGLSKAFWLIFVILVPWLGVLGYLIAHGAEMSSREVGRQQAAQDHFASYVRETAGPGTGAADELTKLAALRDSGVLTDEEFASQKTKLLA
jgi:Na+/proline symporter